MAGAPSTFRPCPRCGSAPASIYAPWPYTKLDGSTGYVRQAYCSACKKTYGPGREPRELLPAQRPPRPPRLAIGRHTLADVLADPEVWTDCPGGQRHAYLARLIVARPALPAPPQPGLPDDLDLCVTPRQAGDSRAPDNLTTAYRACLGFRSSGAGPAPLVCADCGSHNVERVL